MAVSASQTSRFTAPSPTTGRRQRSLSTRGSYARSLSTHSPSTVGILRKDEDGRYWVSTSREAGDKFTDMLAKMTDGECTLISEIENAIGGIKRDSKSGHERRMSISAAIAGLGKLAKSVDEQLELVGKLLGDAKAEAEANGDVFDGEKHLNYTKTKKGKSKYFPNGVKRTEAEDYFAKGGEVDYRGNVTNDVVEDIVKSKGLNVQISDNSINGYEIIGQKRELDK